VSDVLVPVGISDWIVAAVSVLALLVSAAALAYGVRAGRTAARAEMAARLATEFAAGEQRARREQAHDHAIRWRLTRQGAATNELVNIGDETAYDVRVVVPEYVNVLGLPTDRPELRSGESMTIGVARSKLGTMGVVIRVLWRDSPDAPEREWSHPAV
jgi:hypothetical protein